MAGKKNLQASKILARLCEGTATWHLDAGHYKLGRATALQHAGGGIAGRLLAVRFWVIADGLIMFMIRK
jgi:hypothetical protein